MEEKIVSLKVNDNIDKTIAATKSLRAQLREAVAEVQQLSEEFGESSEQAVNAAKRAAGLKDRIEDANDAVQAFKGEGAFLATSKAIGAAASGLAAVQGGLGLIGVEGERVEQTILKVQSAMALSQGLEGLEDAGRSFKQLGVVAANALKGIRTGLAATGIGVFIVALGAVVAYWDEINAAIGETTDTTKEYAEAQTKVTSGLKEFNEGVINVNNSFKAARAGTISKEAALKTYNDTLGKSVGYAGSLEQAEELLAANTAVVVNGIKLRAQAQVFYAKSAEAAAKAVSGEGVDPSFFDEAVNYMKALGNPAIAASLNIKSAARNLETLRNQQKLFAKEGDDLTQQAIENDKNLKKGLAEPPKPPKTAEQLAAEAKAAAEKAKAEREKATKDFLDKLTENAQKEKDINQSIADEQADAIKNLGALKDELIAKDVRNLEVQGQISSTSIAIAGNEYKAKKALADQELADKEKLKEAEFALQEAKVNAAQAAFNILGQLAGQNKTLQRAAILGEAAVGIFRIIKNTQAANAAAVAKYALIPGGQILAAKEILANKINAGVGIATTTAAAARALGSIGAGGSAGGASAGGGSASNVTGTARPETAQSQAPQFNVVGAGGANQLAQAITTNQAPVRAFVVSNDVTTAQSLDRNIVKSASLG